MLLPSIFLRLFLDPVIGQENQTLVAMQRNRAGMRFRETHLFAAGHAVVEHVRPRIELGVVDAFFTRVLLLSQTQLLQGQFSLVHEEPPCGLTTSYRNPRSADRKTRPRRALRPTSSPADRCAELLLRT